AVMRPTRHESAVISRDPLVLPWFDSLLAHAAYGGEKTGETGPRRHEDREVRIGAGQSRFVPRMELRVLGVCLGALASLREFFAARKRCRASLATGNRG